MPDPSELSDSPGVRGRVDGSRDAVHAIGPQGSLVRSVNNTWDRVGTVRRVRPVQAVQAEGGECRGRRRTAARQAFGRQAAGSAPLNERSRAAKRLSAEGRSRRQKLEPGVMRPGLNQCNNSAARMFPVLGARTFLTSASLGLRRSRAHRASARQKEIGTRQGPCSETILVRRSFPCAVRRHVPQSGDRPLGRRKSAEKHPEHRATA